MALPVLPRIAPKFEIVKMLSVAFFSDILTRHFEAFICIENALSEQVYLRSKRYFVA